MPVFSSVQMTQASLLIKAAVQRADIPCLGVKIRVVTIEPIDAVMRFEVSVGKNAPDRRAARRFGVCLVEVGGSDVIQAPARGRALAVRRFVLAMDRTSTCSKGGKAPWSTGARGILQTSEARFKKAVAPLADGMAVAV
jgi:hypothetical protein